MKRPTAMFPCPLHDLRTNEAVGKRYGRLGQRYVCGKVVNLCCSMFNDTSKYTFHLNFLMLKMFAFVSSNHVMLITYFKLPN
jgi:hypothetical protein